MGIDATSERHRSVEAMAEHYANLIDAHWPEGVVHLLGQSAGGLVCVGGGLRAAAAGPQPRPGGDSR
jgi:thioesterase domain-containing protein